MLPYWIPFFGHIFSFALTPDKLLEKARYKPLLPSLQPQCSSVRFSASDNLQGLSTGNALADPSHVPYLEMPTHLVPSPSTFSPPRTTSSSTPLSSDQPFSSAPQLSTSTP
jgi:hypothetical protein